MRGTATIAIVVLAALGAISAPTPGTEADGATETVMTYDVAAVKRQLLLAAEDGELQLQKGDQAHSGDSLRTGSRSTADLEVADRAASFHVKAKTRFHLAHIRPGVLIDIERGSLRAVFGKLPEGEDRERLITTPSAVLAVRGTDFGVNVKKNGDTSVVVFEGTVAVRDLGGAQDVVQVQAGQSTRIRKGRAPSAPAAHGLSAEDWNRGRRVPSSTWPGGQGTPGMGPAGQGAQGAQQGSTGSRSSSSQGGSRRHGG
jgi:hypothetical protein